jgi:hypothetical protein
MVLFLCVGVFVQTSGVTKSEVKGSAWRRRFSKHENLTYQAMMEGPAKHRAPTPSM